jgi:hypothetical protein
MNKSEGEFMQVLFDPDENVEQIKVKEEPVGQYYPEPELHRTDKTLDGFEVREDKPVRR